MLLAPEKHEEKLQNDARTYAYEECKIYIYIYINRNGNEKACAQGAGCFPGEQGYLLVRPIL